MLTFLKTIRMPIKKTITSNPQRYLKISKILYKQVLQLLIANSKKEEKKVTELKKYSKQPKNMLSIYVLSKNKKLYKLPKCFWMFSFLN